VAPNRIGVLHDIAATTRAAAACGLHIAGIVLSAPPTPDASTGSNAAEVPVVTDVPLLASIPRAPADEIAALPEIGAALTRVLR
jgi:dethiobiotin synthetase